MTGWDEYAIPAHVPSRSTRPLPAEMDSDLGCVQRHEYSAPFVSVIDGQARSFFRCCDGSVYALHRAPEIIWTFDASTRRNQTHRRLVIDGVVYWLTRANCGSPAILGPLRFQGVGAKMTLRRAICCATARSHSRRSAPLIIDGRVYFIDDGALMFAVDAKRNGTRQAETRRISSAAQSRATADLRRRIRRFYILEPISSPA